MKFKIVPWTTLLLAWQQKWPALVLTFLLVCTTGGCQSRNEADAETDEMFSVINTMRMQVKEEGIFYIDGTAELMKFYDFSLAESLPICDRPNCEHNSADCSAYLPQGYMSGMGCYRNRLYYYDNMDPELPVYQCEKNGSNRKLLAKLNRDAEYPGLSLTLPVFFAEDEMIFGLEYTELLTKPVEKEDGTLVDQKYFWMLGKLDLEDGAFAILKEPQLYDGYTHWIQISDFTEGNLFYDIAEGATLREQHIYNIETLTDEVLFKESESPVNYKGIVRSMGREIYSSDDGHTCRVYTVDAKTKEEEIIAEIELGEGKELFHCMAGDDLIYCVYEKGKTPAESREFGAINLKTGEQRSLTKEEYWYAPTIAATKNWYVGTAEEGPFCISKADYEDGNWNNIQVVIPYH